VKLWIFSRFHVVKSGIMHVSKVIGRMLIVCLIKGRTIILLLLNNLLVIYNLFSFQEI
jgi:hypothetical protein